MKSVSPQSAVSRSDVLKKFQADIESQGFSGFVMPKTDPHRMEYSLPFENVLEFLTGFSGSMGFCAVMCNRAAVFVDGRYTVQAKSEVDDDLFEQEDYSNAAIIKWVSDGLNSGDRVAYDPFLLSKREFDHFQKAFSAKGILLEPLEKNTLFDLWVDRPAEFIPEILPHGVECAGQEFPEKLAQIRLEMQAKNVDGFFINSPETIAWLFNVRSPKRFMIPAPSSYAYVPLEGQCTFFIRESQRSQDLLSHLKGHVELAPYEGAFSFLQKCVNKKVYLDPSNATMKIVNALQDAVISYGYDLCSLPRSCKNETEVSGTRQAHIRDAGAVCDLLAWLEDKLGNKVAVSEIEVDQRLLESRKAREKFQGVSFESITGSGPHGAVVHYRVSEKTNRTLGQSELFLLDSGGQYLDGTTDVTRTISCNKAPTAEQKDRYTRVLKGHIALAKAVFPEGTSGHQLDILARNALWQGGYDYAHGTGHGVGSFLGVHEGPQRIAPFPNSTALKAGMILSNEPGYYKEGEYGIRIENLVVVQKAHADKRVENAMLCFETVTLIPIDTSLIERDLMTDAEIQWLNGYHQKVRDSIMPQVRPETKAWLEKATKTFRN